MEENVDTNDNCPTCGKPILKGYGMPDIVKINGKLATAYNNISH